MIFIMRSSPASQVLKVLKFKVLSLITLLIFELLNAWNLEPLFAQGNYYQGKTIRVIVGYQAGDSHDQWARTYTRYLGKYIPGNPNFLVQNMPGAGGMIAANYIYNIAKQDGLTMGTIWRGVVLRPTDRPQRGEIRLE